ncbi:MAG: hypothetical protein HY758_06775 [Nitrospirae bacterium]|nr:hypothetical protein [Nitrospirota bacterium]
MEEVKLIGLDLSNASEEVIEILLLDSTAEPSLFDEIARSNTHRPEILRFILSLPGTPEETRQLISQQLPEEFIEDKEYQDKALTLLQRIQKLKAGERIQLAFRGSKDIRTILLRDPNKEVMLSVLENPKITENEIELLAKQKATSEEIIRVIAKKREWLKNYSIVYALVTNPKTPVAAAMKFVNRLSLKDLSSLEKDKNISGAVREIAKKIVAAKKPA